MHIHRYHRKLSAIGTGVKTLSHQLVQWTGHSTAPLWPGRINAASPGVKVLPGVRWDMGGMHGALWAGESGGLGGHCWTICKGVRCGPASWMEGNATLSTLLFLSRIQKGTWACTPNQTSTCLQKKQIKWAQYFHLKISFKGILSCLKRWIHCVCFLH